MDGKAKVLLIWLDSYWRNEVSKRIKGNRPLQEVEILQALDLKEAEKILRDNPDVAAAVIKYDYGQGDDGMRQAVSILRQILVGPMIAITDDPDKINLMLGAGCDLDTPPLYLAETILNALGIPYEPF